MRPPKVSVCIPTYKGAPFLRDAVESVLSQSFQEYELIVVDNCSGDGTEEIVRGYMSKDPRIRFEVNDSNIGMVQNWNRCLGYAGGEYVKFVFADDLLSSKDTLRKMVSVLDADETIVLVASARNIVDETLNLTEVWSPFGGDCIMEGEEVIRSLLPSMRNDIGEPTAVMFRKPHATRGFDVKYRQLVDLEMWFHILERGRLAYIKEPLCAFRIHPGQVTKDNLRNFHYLDDMFLLLKDYSGKSYMKTGRLTRGLMSMERSYDVWKLYKKHMISQAQALTKIGTHYGLLKFYALYPPYKVYRTIFKRNMTS